MPLKLNVSQMRAKRAVLFVAQFKEILMCNCSSGSKDQTKAAVFDYLESKGFNALGNNEIKGFGLFLIPAPEIGILETRTVTVDGLTYKETVKRGSNCLAFQWIPSGISHTLSSGKALAIQSPQDIDLVALDCTSSRCKPSGCPMGCFCYSNEVGNCHH